MSNFNSTEYRLAVKRTEQLRAVTKERDEAREALRCTEDALQGMTALCAAWTELAVARGQWIKARHRPGAVPADYRAEVTRVHEAKEALVKLGVPEEAL